MVPPLWTQILPFWAQTPPFGLKPYPSWDPGTLGPHPVEKRRKKANMFKIAKYIHLINDCEIYTRINDLKFYKLIIIVIDFSLWIMRLYF